MSTLRTLPLALGIFLAGGCDQIESLTGIKLGGAADPQEVVAAARNELDAGDLPAAMSQYETIAKENEDVALAQIGLAYTQLLAGQYDKADKTLQNAQGIEGLEDSVKNEISLRRALVALRKGDLNNIKKHGEASGLPAGQVLAAEAYLADAESDSAIPLLESASSAGGEVGSTAKTYLDYLNDSETGRAQLAEATALWALGQREEACETAEELLKFLPAEYGKRDELLLLWAGRAVASGRPAVAEGLLDDMSGAPEGQAWRVQATRAMILVANDEFDEATAVLTGLAQGGAPADGLADAIATAAAISDDADFARNLVGNLNTAAAARGLMAAGANDAAKSAAPSGTTFAKYLENL